MQNFGEFALKVAESGDPSDMMAYTTAETAAVDAALKKVRSQAYQADAGKVSKGGDTMTGRLTLNAGLTVQSSGNAQQIFKAGASPGWVVEQQAGGTFSIGRVSFPGGGDAIRIDHNNLGVTVVKQLHLGAVPTGSPTPVAPGTGWLLLDRRDQTVKFYDHGSFVLLVQLAAAASSRRFKHDIIPAGDVPDIAALNPVTFRWNDDAPTAVDDREHLGLIAEQVADVDPRLAQYGGDGQVAGLDHHALFAALVDKCQKLEARIEALEGGV